MQIKPGIIFAFLSLSISLTKSNAASITDNFDTLNTSIWGCEYACPTISNGYARFNIEPGTLNTNTTWNKLSHKNKAFGYGTYAMKFRFNRRPIETEVWAGWALYSETSTGQINEINFGVETACLSRCSDKSIITESYKNSSNIEIVITRGVSLFDGTWHTAELTYSAAKIVLKLDGDSVASITDSNKIPTVTMALIPGARVVKGILNSPFYMDIDSISFPDLTNPITSIQPRQSKMNSFEKANVPAPLYDVAGKELAKEKGLFRKRGLFTK